MTLTIRPLLPDDVPTAQACSFAAFTDLDRRLSEPVPEPTEDVRRRGELRIAHLQRTDPDGAWVAEQDGRLVGLALATRRDHLWFLSLLVVEPGLQSQGVGKRLLEAALGSAEDAAAGLILSTADPRALRRYALAGFTVHPGLAARGPVDRSTLPATQGVRDGDLQSDAGLVDEVGGRLRGAAYGPDLEAFAQAGVRLLVVEEGPERGFAVIGPQQLGSLGATTPELAQRLLWAYLAQVEGEADVKFLTADQQWAIEVCVASGLPLRFGSSSCRRGALGPMTPYLPSGAYG